MVCVPAFGATGEVALVHLDTLECTPIRFASAVGPPDSMLGESADGAAAGNDDGGRESEGAMDVEEPAD